MASPFYWGGTDSEMVVPAVKGTLSVMTACMQSHVTRLVITGSIASAIYPPQRPKGEHLDG